MFAGPNTTQIQTFEEAIKQGDVTWHAFPHNAQLEIMDPTLIQASAPLDTYLARAYLARVYLALVYLARVYPQASGKQEQI